MAIKVSTALTRHPSLISWWVLSIWCLIYEEISIHWGIYCFCGVFQDCVLFVNKCLTIEAYKSLIGNPLFVCQWKLSILCMVYEEIVVHWDRYGHHRASLNNFFPWSFSILCIICEENVGRWHVVQPNISPSISLSGT